MPNQIILLEMLNAVNAYRTCRIFSFVPLNGGVVFSIHAIHKEVPTKLKAGTKNRARLPSGAPVGDQNFIEHKSSRVYGFNSELQFWLPKLHLSSTIYSKTDLRRIKANKDGLTQQRHDLPSHSDNHDQLKIAKLERWSQIVPRAPVNISNKISSILLIHGLKTIQ